MLVCIYGARCIGIDAVKVTVEIEIGRGIGIHLVGLADIAVKESLLRTTTALQALEYRIPGKKIVINLAPADLHKRGSGYDLPIAVGIIAASGQETFPDLSDYIIMGELGLDGSVRKICGALPYAELASSLGLRGVILPLESALEAADIRDIRVYGVSNLQDVIRILSGGDGCEDLLVWNNCRYFSGPVEPPETRDMVDFADIVGQEGAKRGLVIAASGGHNVILVGSPGSGKSSLAKALAGILPPMTREESIVTSKIYSTVGRGGPRVGLIRQRPFRAPHYSATVSALIGGGAGDSIMPGEVSLAQNGVLFLDEAGQMCRSSIEALRAPLEDRVVTVSRLRAKVEYPASFMLVAATNPCPCGYWGEDDRCNCTPMQRMNYLSRISGPMMDRIDIHLWLHSVPPEKLLEKGDAETSASVAARVRAAREIQAERFRDDNVNCNAEMSNRQVERYCPLDDDCRETLGRLMKNIGLSMRAYFRIIKVARSIADLEGSCCITPAHIMEAVTYRFLDEPMI